MASTEKMTREQLAAFVFESKKLFGAGTDQAIFALALPRIAEMRASAAMAALHDYAVEWGGARRQFFVSSFFDFAGKVTRASAEARERDQRMLRSIRKTREQIEIDAQWQAHRDAVASADPDARAAAVAFLRRSGWGDPPAMLEAWSRSWILAVSDLIARRGRLGYSVETGGFTEPLSAEAFWGQLRPSYGSMTR